MKVTICIGSACHLKGSRKVIQGLQELVAQNGLTDKVDMSGSFCSGDCVMDGVCVEVDGEKHFIKPEEVKEFFDKEILGRL